jgi:hypothetical protein
MNVFAVSGLAKWRLGRATHHVLHVMQAQWTMAWGAWWYMHASWVLGVGMGLRTSHDTSPLHDVEQGSCDPAVDACNCARVAERSYLSEHSPSSSARRSVIRRRGFSGWPQAGHAQEATESATAAEG